MDGLVVQMLQLRGGWGWAERGRRVRMTCLFLKARRVSMVALKCVRCSRCLSNAKIEQSVEVSPNDADLRVVAEGCCTIAAILEKVY